MASVALQLMLPSFFCGGRAGCVTPTEGDAIPPLPQRRRQAAAPAPAVTRTGGLREKEGDCFNGVSGEGHCFNGGIALCKINWPKYICVPAGHLLGFSPSTQSVTGEEGKMVPALFRKRPRSLILTELEEWRMSRLVTWVARTKCYQQTKTCPE